MRRSKKWRSSYCVSNLKQWQFLTLIIVSLGNSYAYSQSAKKEEEKDSLKFYKKIKLWAQKHHLTKLAYEAVFVDPESKEYPVEPVVSNKEKKQTNPYIKNERKIIRKVNITVLDPFGYSFNDTCCKRLNYLERTGNRAHFRTRHWIISNRLLFKKNDSINPLALSESERLLREAPFVTDARVFITKTGNKDTVDVNVIVIDKWAITAPAEVTNNSGNIRFRNQNLFGLGQYYEQYIAYKMPNRWDHTGQYSIPNIEHTYISSQIGYAWHPEDKVAYINFSRPFFSPLSNWSWGTNFYNYWGYYHYTDSIDSISSKATLSHFNYDLWLNRSFKLNNTKTFFNQSTNIIVGIRHYAGIYLSCPSTDIDPKRSVASSSAIIGNVGFAVQQYYKERFVYRFGANEDVPEGLIIQFTYGALKPEFSKLRYYVGGEIARAKHFSFGYFTATLSSGMFFNKDISNDITNNLNLYYFSNLARNGRWFFRQFFNYKLVHGMNKFNDQTIYLTADEMYGFNHQMLNGKTKMIFNSETVAYAPYTLIGFRFAPVMQIGLGMMGDQENTIMKSRLYQGYKIGVLIRNENLLNSTFQFAIGLYPFLPTTGEFKFVFNPGSSFNLRVRAFNMSRPEFVSYN